MEGRVDVADLLGNAPEWQERALCSQTDPEAFFPGEGWLDPRSEADLLAAAKSRTNAWSTRWATTNGSASGVDCRSVNVAS